MTNPGGWRRASGEGASLVHQLPRLLITVVLGAAVAPLAAQPTAPLALLTNAQQVLALGIPGARQAPHPVRLRGVVTWPVLRRPWFYVQDATAGILVVCTNSARRPSGGQLLAVVGRAGLGLQAPLLYDASYTVIGAAPLPAPPRAAPSRLPMAEELGL